MPYFSCYSFGLVLWASTPIVIAPYAINLVATHDGQEADEVVGFGVKADCLNYFGTGALP